MNERPRRAYRYRRRRRKGPSQAPARSARPCVAGASRCGRSVNAGRHGEVTTPAASATPPIRGRNSEPSSTGLEDATAGEAHTIQASKARLILASLSFATSCSRSSPRVRIARDAKRHGRDQLEQQKRKTKNGNEDQPIEKEIARIDRKRGPRVRRSDANARSEVIAVGTKPGKLGRLAVRPIRSPGQSTPNLVEILALPPGRQPRSDVPAARDGREKLKPAQQ